MKNLKRVITLALVFCMLLTSPGVVLPMQAAAAELGKVTEPSTDPTTATTSPETDGTTAPSTETTTSPETAGTTAPSTETTTSSETEDTAAPSTEATTSTETDGTTYSSGEPEATEGAVNPAAEEELPAPPTTATLWTSFLWQSGGEKTSDPENENVDTRTVLIGSKEETTLDVYVNAGFGSGTATGLTLDIRLPYFYRNKTTDEIVTTHEESTDSNLERVGCVKARIVDPYKFDNTTAEAEYSHFGGPLVIHQGDLQLRANAGEYVRIAFMFDGDIPENTVGYIFVGASYDTYVDNTGVKYGSYTLDPMKADERGIFTLINSNLKWEPHLEQVGEQVLWNEYNYMTFKITMDNTSDDPNSYYDEFDLTMRFPVEGDEQGWGVLMKDLLAWYYAEDGVTKVKNDEGKTSADFTGVPGEGGVLIYDVTGKTDAELAGWDLETYSNVTEPTLSYRWVNRHITVSMEDTKMMPGDKRTYYVAIPFTTIIPDSMLDYVQMTLFGTIRFNQNVTWSKVRTLLGTFAEPKPQFSHEKYLLDETGNKVEKLTIGIGDTAEYYIGGLSAAGSNVPVFNPVITDTLPDKFKLDKLVIELGLTSDPAPTLKKWFKTKLLDPKNPDLLQMEFEDKQGNTKFVDIAATGNFTLEGDVDGYRVWSINAAALVSNYEASNTGWTFTGRMRFNLKERFEKNTGMDGRIKVVGTAPVLEVYENSINTTYEQWHWYPVTSSNPVAGYQQWGKVVSPVETATVETAPGNPLLRVDGYWSYGDTLTVDDEVGVPMMVPGAGFLYTLGNDSVSAINPAVFSSGDVVNAQGYGLDVSKIVLSKELLERSKISSITVVNVSGGSTSINLSNYTADGEGDITILSGDWNGTLKSVTIRFESFNKKIPLADGATILLYGTATRLGKITATGSFQTEYKDPAVDKNKTDPGTLNAKAIEPILQGRSYGPGTISGWNNPSTPAASIAQVELGNKIKDAGYEFEFYNNSDAAAGEVYVWVDLSSSVGVKNDLTADPTTDPIVKGFDTTDVYISDNHEDVGKLVRVDFWDWDKDPDTDTPDVSIALADIPKEADGTLHIDSTMLGDIDYVLRIRLVFDDVYGHTTSDKPSLNIKVNGITDWFTDPQGNKLDAVMTFQPTNPTMSTKIRSVTARIDVPRPALLLHTHIEYYSNTPETSHNQGSNSDGNLTRLGIPYDRNFTFRVNVENKSLSTLDDVVMLTTLPVKVESEEIIGFHTTGVKIMGEFFNLYGEPKYEKPNTLTLRDVLGTVEAVFTYDAAQDAYVYGTMELAIAADGSLSISQTQLEELGIITWNADGKLRTNDLLSLEFDGDEVKRRVVAEADGIDVDKAYIDFYGYSDTNIGGENTVKANSTNYLDGIRETQYEVKANDSSTVTISKMYFDTVLAAGFKDAGTTADDERFDETTHALEHIRHYSREGNSHANYGAFNDDSELDIGYKAIGSYMLDFRQYLNAGTNYPEDYQEIAGDWNYYTQEHAGMNYIYTQSFNTAADVELTMNLPTDKFDPYYLKVHPKTFEYLQSITLIRESGAKEVIEAEWATVAASLEDSDDGKYYVIGLLPGAEDKYKSPDSRYVPEEDPVVQIVFVLRINEDETTEDGTLANEPDYGTWYNANDQDTKYMFEVTGRFYKTGTAIASANTKLTIGDGERSKERTDTGDPSDDYRSKWSYFNRYAWWYYVYYSSHNHGYPKYDAQHMQTKARVNVKNDASLVLKGVHGDPTVKSEDDYVEYGTEQFYTVSFYRNSSTNTTNYNVHQANDYSNGSNSSPGSWYSQDPNDWAGKVSFVDQVRLTDTLPPLKADPDTEYYGFRPTKLYISDELYQDMKQGMKQGMGVLKLYDQSGAVLTVTKTGTVTDEDGNETPYTYQEENLMELLAWEAAAGYWVLHLEYAELSDDDTGAANSYELPTGTYLGKYEIYISNLGGNGDYARELAGRTDLKTPDTHGDNKTVDIMVGGIVHVINTDPWQDGTNTIKSEIRNDFEDTLDEDGNITASVWRAQNSDTGRLRGFLKPFQAGHRTELLDSDNVVYDYSVGNADPADDNMLPEYASFGVKLWNRPDASTDVDDQSARIKKVTVESQLPYGYNLKQITFPTALVSGNWFRVSSIKFTYNGGTVVDELDANEMKTYWKTEGTNTYFDVKQYVIDNLDDFPTYAPGVNTNATYVRERIEKFTVVLSAVAPDVKNPETTLQGGEYLTPEKTEGYSFTYSGTWVDRPVDEVKNNQYTANSRPALGMTPNYYYAEIDWNEHSRHYTEATFTPADFNAAKYSDLGGTNHDINYWFYNRVSQMWVELERGTVLEEDDTSITTFAYDRDKINGVDEELAVDVNHLAPYDYIDYTLTVGAAEGEDIPLQHTDLRFTVPEGQRIVGWKVVSTDADEVPESEITATVKDADGNTIELTAGQYYMKAGTADTNFREINISLGDSGDVANAHNDQIHPGETIKVVVYTQMMPLYDADGNFAFEGKTVTDAVYEAAAVPSHTYSQYMITCAGNNDDWNSGTSASAYHSVDNNGTENYYRYDTDFYRLNGTPYKGVNYTSRVTSGVKYKDASDLVLEHVFLNTDEQYDRKPMEVRVKGTGTNGALTNDMRHTMETVTMEVSFLSPYPTAAGLERMFQSFQLTQLPTFWYPSNMDIPTDVAEADWVPEDYYLVRSKAATTPEVTISAQAEGDYIWVKRSEIKTDLNPNGTYTLAEILGVKWTYYDVPAWGSDGNEVLYADSTNPIVFKGIGIYNDIRENTNTAIADWYDMKLSATITPVHKHYETRNADTDAAVIIEEKVNFHGEAESTVAIARERPIITWQTQIFDSEGDAAAKWNPDAAQRNGYRPGEELWFKLVLQNNEAANPAKDMQGVMLNPVIFDKIPEYVTQFISETVKYVWYDADDNVKETGVPKLEYALTGDDVEAYDYGGEYLVPKSGIKEGTNGNLWGKNFDEIKPSDTNSTKIDYDVYTFTFKNDDGSDVRLEIGERIEIWYKVQVRTTELPMTYVYDTSGNVYPEYFPKLGEYYQIGFSSGYHDVEYSWPLLTGRVGSLADGAIRTVNNADVMMDMNYIIHDAGVSGKSNGNVDKWEFLKDARVYIPGTSTNNYYYYDYIASVGGNNETLMDYDIASASTHQLTVYTPAAQANNLQAMPGSIKYVQSGSTTSRDLYEYVVKPRTHASGIDWDGAHDMPVVWAEARTHLQTAWLAASSQIEPDAQAGETIPQMTTSGQQTGAGYLSYTDHARKYLPNAWTAYWTGNTDFGLNPNYGMWIYGSDHGDTYGRRTLFADDFVPTLEYKETYTAKLGAYNYGDWHLDGVEFIYVMPKGTSPQLGEDGKPIVTAYTNTARSSQPGWAAIDSEIDVEILQKPGDTEIDYKSPKSWKDPWLSQIALAPGESTAEAYYESEVAESWVLKITVKHKLGEWFNRGAAYGYMMEVRFPCVIDYTNENEYWYDQVFVSPWEDTADGHNDKQYYQIYDITSYQGATRDKSNLTSFLSAYGYGHLKYKSLSTQWAGMDYLWDGFDDYNSVDPATNYHNGSPNMPYIDGYNIQNKEVDVNGTAIVMTKDFYKNGDQVSYATTGTRAYMRKPLIRTWTTMGEDLVGTDPDAYYLEPEADKTTMNIHVENRYWWDSQTTNYSTKYTSGHASEYHTWRHRNNYSTNGGNMGTLFYPVVTSILPEGVVPMDTEGNPFTKDTVGSKTLSWTLYNNDLSKMDGTVTDVANEMALYTALVEYIYIDVLDDSGMQVMDENGDPKQEGRFRITFYQDQTQKGSDPDAVIAAEDRRIFSYDIITVAEPDKLTAEGTVEADLLAQYQSTNIYVTSQLQGFKFLIDSDIPSNPYYVGANYEQHYRHEYHVSDSRYDAIRVKDHSRSGHSSTDGCPTGGYLPNLPVSILNNTYRYSIIDAVEDKGVKRYYEETGYAVTDGAADKTELENYIFNLEDYTTIRNNVVLSPNQLDFDRNGSISDADGHRDSGVTTSMRIRLTYPKLGTQIYVSNNETALGESSTPGVSPVRHYPTTDFDSRVPDKTVDADHMQFGDILWYSTVITNGPDSATDYSHKGSIQHAEIIVSVKLPSIVSYENEFVLLDKNGNLLTVNEDTNPLGWKVELVRTVEDATTGEETHVFKIMTPGETLDYLEYMQGAEVPGYFEPMGKFTLKLKTSIDSLQPPATVQDPTADYWDGNYYAESYATLHNTDGSYLTPENYPDMTQAITLAQLSTELMGFANQVVETPGDPENGVDEVDYDFDGDATETHAYDLSARVTVLKPTATVRLDTSIPRFQITSSDTGRPLSQDASIKGATVSMVYLDMAVNEGGAVAEFIVDYVLPHRGLPKFEPIIAPMDADHLTTTVQSVRSGVWELPAGLDDDTYDALMANLRVNVYALVVPATQNIHLLPYDEPNKDDYPPNAGWLQLGSYTLDENGIATVPADYQNAVLQLRFVVKAEGDEDARRKYPVPQGLRLAIDADPTKDGSQEMDEIDPYRDNLDPLPDSVKKNAAFVELKVKQTVSTEGNLHGNFFATAWGRYDNSQYSPLSEAARAGYYVNTELPVMAKGLRAYYFHRSATVDEDGKRLYEWSGTDLIIKPSYSTMLMYRSTYRSMTTEEIRAEGMVDEQDNATSPSITVILPYIQNIKTGPNQFIQVDRYSPDYDTAYVNMDYTKWGGGIDGVLPQWTWYVADGDGNLVTNHQITGCTIRMYDKPDDVDDTRNRRMITWDFKGYLQPGETLVVDYMVPVTTKDYGMVSPHLMGASSFGFLAGNYTPFVPSVQEHNNFCGIYTDGVRDINDDGNADQMMLRRDFTGIAFESTRNVNTLKESFSEYHTQGMGSERPALVPEGTDYSFASTVLNPGEYEEKGYNEVVIYDVLPYPDDYKIFEHPDGDDTVPMERGSQWSGWLKPETIKVTMTSTPPSGLEVLELEDGKHYEAWIGPFVKKGNEILLKEISDLPPYMIGDDSGTSKTKFYADMYDDEDMREQYFVKLSDFKKLDQQTQYKYSKKIQAIWIQIKNNAADALKDPLAMNGKVKFELSYSLHAPLNLPQYDGAILPDMLDTEVMEKISEYVGWNTFVTQSQYVDNGNPMDAQESPQAGVYLDAPIEKGYIGSYVWYDDNYNAIVDDGTYERRDDGRLIFKEATVDIDHDGSDPDDPGINRVLVELLTENGYPANKRGQAVVYDYDEATDQMRYFVINETTGEKAKNNYGEYEYTNLGPASFITEEDAYGNNGYYILSNLTPGKYKLRFTFPEGTYNEYAVTTLKIGDTQVPVDIYRDGEKLPDLGNSGIGDVACDAQVVNNRLVVQTREAITVEAIGTDPETYPAYDEKMTSYNVGVSKAHIYGGYAWVDESNTAPPSNGIMDNNETRLQNVDVTIYKVDPTDGTLSVAKDVEGKELKGIRTDENGYFEVRLYPGDYVAWADPTPTAGVYKPTPVTLTSDPLENPRDNDLAVSGDKTHNETSVFRVEIRYDPKTGKPITNSDGNYGTFDYIGLGFVPSGRADIGKFVWDDKNYDGIRGNYLDENGQLQPEPGIEGVKLILEKYYYDPEAKVDETGAAIGEWKFLGETSTTSNAAGSYSFQNVTTSHTANSKLYLAGYKVRVDLDSLPAGYKDYLATKFQTNNGNSDSDLPVLSEDGYLIASNPADMDSEGMIIMAEEVSAAVEGKTIAHGNRFFDPQKGKSLLDLDVGLVQDESDAKIIGRVWEDKEYDGIQGTYTDEFQVTSDEPGIPDISVDVERWYYKYDAVDENGKPAPGWVMDEAFLYPLVSTDEDGYYVFDDLPSYVVIGSMDGGTDKETIYLAGYKVKLTTIDREQYAVTLLGEGTEDLDSDLLNDTLYLTEEDEYIILANKVTDPKHSEGYIVTDGVEKYDIVKAHNVDTYDAGLTTYNSADISGRVWEDLIYNGIQEQFTDENGDLINEPGLADYVIKAEQFYYDESFKDENGNAAPRWVRVDPETYDVTVKPKDDGTYLLANQPTYYTDEAGVKHLAGYRLKVEFGESIDWSKYAVTLRGEGTEDVDSDLVYPSMYLMPEGEYIILAQELTGFDPDRYNVITIEGIGSFDITMAVDSEHNDAGLATYQNADITGRVWEDLNYNGIQDPGEPGLSGYQIIVEQYYFKDSQWHLNEDYVLIVEAEPGEDEEEPTEPGEDEEEPTDPSEGGDDSTDPSEGGDDSTDPGEGGDDSTDPSEGGDDSTDPSEGEDDSTDPSEGEEDPTDPGEDEEDPTEPEEDTKPANSVITDKNGNFVIPDQVNHITDENGVKYLIGYRLKIYELDREVYAVTYRKVGDSTVDSDLVDATLYFMADGEYILLAEKVEDPAPDRHNIVTAGGLGSFDIVIANDSEHNDAGLTTFHQASLSGKIWEDTDYNGILDSQEPGIQDVSLTLHQYYLGADGQWKAVPEDQWDPLEHQTLTDEKGEYIFNELYGHVLIDGMHYMAGYKVVADETTIPDTAFYGITLYKVEMEEGQRNSDLNDRYEIHNGSAFAVVATDVTDAPNQNTPYTAEVDGRVYDYFAVSDSKYNDGGFAKFNTSVIHGNIFEDRNRDGLLDEKDVYKRIKDALAEGEQLEITLTAHYLDNKGVWQTQTDEDGEPVTWTAVVGEDGSYRFGNVPTSVYIQGSDEEKGTRYLAGYKLYLNLMPAGYEAAEHLANDGIGDSSLVVAEDGTVKLTKTVSIGYAGTEFEEKDGYIITAVYCGDDPTVSKRTSVHGYDMLGSKVLTYNAGLVNMKHPLTGDSMNLILLIALMAVSLAGIAYILVFNKKKKAKEQDSGE